MSLDFERLFKTTGLAALVIISTVITAPVSASTVFFGPTPYLSSSDIPAGFYAGGTPLVLEDFEDDSLDFGITASIGTVIGPEFGLTDSVDADDGNIDGSGSDGHSWFGGNNTGPGGITFTFPDLPTAAGVVWTDGGGSTVTFEAFGPGMTSLGTIGPVALQDGGFVGGTAEDRFFGVQHSDGVLAIKLTNSAGGIEADHVQSGVAVPEPGTSMLFFAACTVIAVRRRRRPQLV